MSTNESDSELESSDVDDRLVPVDSRDRCVAEVSEGNVSPLSEVKSKLNVQVSGSQVDQVGARINNHAENITFVLQVQPQEQGRLTSLVLEKLETSEAGERVSAHRNILCLIVLVFPVVLLFLVTGSLLLSVHVNYTNPDMVTLYQFNHTNDTTGNINTTQNEFDTRKGILMDKEVITQPADVRESRKIIQFRLPTITLSNGLGELEVHHIFGRKHNNYKKANNVEITVKRCAFHYNCVSKLHGYPYIDYNFVLSENTLFIGRGWMDSSANENTLELLLISKDYKVGEKQIYIYLLLINASVRCGLLNKNFTVKINGKQHLEHILGYERFTHIVIASQEEKYFVDNRDWFVSDSIAMSEQIDRLCFFNCENTCSQQECLRTVCHNVSSSDQHVTSACFVQCVT
ncbi:hypothetical protein J6590_024098 [Homalodisca vitripennis]|nr:hypothetical protein J6590_024098 [Homalodisca vitripennis]